MNFKPSEPITAGRSQEPNRRQFLGGSDARIIMSPDEVGADPALEGKARGGRARGSERQPYRPTGRRHRASEPDLVRAQCWAGRNGRSALGSAPCPSVLGGDPGRVRQRSRRRIRGQVHAALVVLRRGGCRKAYGSAPAQHVGDQRPVGGAFDHHRRGQMDRDDHTRRRARTSIFLSPPSVDFGAASKPARRQGPMGSNRRGLASKRFVWST